MRKPLLVVWVSILILATLICFTMKNWTTHDYTYILQRYSRPRLTTISSSSVSRRLMHASQISYSAISAFDRLLMCSKRIVWGIQASADSVGTEVYVYGYDILRKWECFYRVLTEAGVSVSREVPTLPFTAGMISFEMETGETDVYNLHHPHHGYCVHVSDGGIVRLKNRYRFFNVSRREDAIRILHRLGLRAPVAFATWRFSLCVAEKSKGRTGLYFSGVECRDILASGILPNTIKGLESVPSRCILDVGYDVIEDRIMKVGLYGSQY